VDHVEAAHSEGARDSGFLGDALMKLTAYRLATELATATWEDGTELSEDSRTRALAPQLVLAVGSIGANIAEGYSRLSGRDRVRFFEYALGSTRESVHWYHVAGPLLSPAVRLARANTLSRIRQLLLATIANERQAMPVKPNASGG
jgi:four helix bundle protein